jgi:ABC-2 type transport system ATP-binding protein
VQIDGRPVDDLRTRAQSGYMPERLGFDRDSTGAAFLAFHWRLTGGDPGETPRRVAAAAQSVGLEASALSKRLRTYSRGMLQRIGVAQAMLNDPRLLFLDEPASGTDPLGVAVVRERILEAKRRGATIVLNSHQLTEVERVCDRVLFLDHGRLTRDETLQGAAASRRRTAVRVSADRLDDAVRVLAEAGVAAEPVGDGVLRLSDSSDVQVSAAVKALALADVAVLEVRASAELEELFREKESLPS